MQKKTFFGLNFTSLTTNEIVEQVVSTQSIDDSKFKLLVTTNVDHLVTMQKNNQFKKLCEDAWIVTADGFPVFKFLRFMNQDVKGRITGADLFPKIMNKLDQEKHSPYFIVAQKNTAYFLKRWLIDNNFKGANERVIVPDFGFEKDQQFTEEILTNIAQNNVTHLFFGVGAPKSELWMDTNRDKLQGVKGFGFGAGIDFFAGEMKRAPLWMQKFGLEWLFRLLSEPRRLAKRYLISSWSFLFLAIAEYKQHKDTQ
ncbi:WecB/TagA/CpsF family glycosyltransferase [Colwellia sp. E2M01]|uniref:WecB/TagA/CpsF family glycosyltransferase n=1 Tax=Colwellia sp. E2M01 TaxID=2841561 RepID=UPI001C091D50|nr:WecB/TagA/CpsF family glycosyltransferase [Colwellia sp. E2M01]MBU2870030.1 WecB/TagA/CpsF family glycosyltransferase [Colwellia sp. E2M01]